MKIQTLVLWSIVIVSGALASAMLTKGHDWGDDFAAYIMQAAGIAHGTVREPVAHMAFTMRESSRPYGPVAAPWGFPVLLAPFYIACGGLNIFCLKFINVLFFALFLIAWFGLLTRRLSLVDSAICLSLLAFNPALLSFQNNVLSDITFLFFSTLSVLLIDTVVVAPAKPEGSLSGNVWLGIVFFAAFSVRPNGFLLVPTLFLTQALVYWGQRSTRPRWRAVLPIALIPYVVFGVLTLVLLTTLPSVEASYLSHFKALTRRALFENMSVYASCRSSFSSPSRCACASFLRRVGSVPDRRGRAAAQRRRPGADLHRIDAVALHHVAVSGGTSLPISAAALLDLPRIPRDAGRRSRGDRTSTAAAAGYSRARVWVAVLATFLLTSFRLARANLRNQRATDDGPFEPGSAAMLDVIRTQTAPDSVVLFWKPRRHALDDRP